MKNNLHGVLGQVFVRHDDHHQVYPRSIHLRHQSNGILLNLLPLEK